jgi:hypothetical protein
VEGSRSTMPASPSTLPASSPWLLLTPGAPTASKHEGRGYNGLLRSSQRGCSTGRMGQPACAVAHLRTLHRHRRRSEACPAACGGGRQPNPFAALCTGVLHG